MGVTLSATLPVNRLTIDEESAATGQTLVACEIPIRGRESAPQPPQNAAKEAQCALGIALGEGQAAEKQAEVAAVGGAHCGGRVARGDHGLFDDSGEKIERARGCDRPGICGIEWR